MQYFVVMIDYGGAVARRSLTPRSQGAREVISRVTSGEYQNISFIHEIAENSVEDVTEAILAEAALPQIPPEDVDLQAIRHDHARDLRKHEKV
jgi:predicted DNA-binding protein